MEVTFPDGLAVEAHFDQFSVRTDLPRNHGGLDSAPAPFDLFLAAIATCAGHNTLRFCQERNLSTAGLRLSLWTEQEAGENRLSKLIIDIQLPQNFPDKYRRAIVRATNQCSVKRTILDPPEFQIMTTQAVCDSHTDKSNVYLCDVNTG